MSILDSVTGKEAPMEDGLKGVAYQGDASEGAPDGDWLDRARIAFQSGKDFINSDRRRAWVAALNHFRGKHAPGSIYESDLYKFRSRLFRPKSREAMKKGEAAAAAAFFSTADVVSIEPDDEASEQARVAAEVISELVNHRLTNDLPWFQTVIGAFQGTGIQGIACSKQYWEFVRNGAGEVVRDGLKVELIPPDRLLFDPGSDWIDPVAKSPWIVYRVPLTVGYVKRQIASGEWLPIGNDMWSGCRVDNNDPMVDKPNVADMNRNQPMKDHEQVWVHENIMQDNDGVDMHYWTLGDGKALLSKPRPLAEVYLHCAYGKRPFVAGYADIEIFNPYPAGKLEQTKDLQIAANKIQNMRMDGVSMGLYSRLFVDATNAQSLAAIGAMPPGGVAAVQNPQNIREIKPSDVHQSAYVEQQYLNNDFDGLVGSFGQESVATSRQLGETAKGMQILSASANSITEYAIRTFSETWMEPVLRQVVDLVQAYESDLRVIAIAGGRSKLIRAGADATLDDIFNQRLLVKVSVGVGATNPATKMQNLMQAMGALMQVVTPLAEMFGTPLVLESPGVREVAKEIFGAAGYKDGERFMDFAPPPPENPEPPAEQVEFEQKVQLEQLKSDQKMKALEARHQMKLAEMNDQQAFDAKRAILDAGLRYQASQAQMSKSKSPEHRRVAAAMGGQ